MNIRNSHSKGKTSFLRPPTVLQDFQIYLKTHRLAPEKSIPFLAHWAERYLDFLGRHPALPVQEKLSRFLEELAGRVQDWQVRQATTAVNLYTSHFKGTQEATNEGKKVESWDEVLRSLRNILRLRHYSPNMAAEMTVIKLS